MTDSEIIQMLDLQPHPEGGAFRETYRSEIKAKLPEDRSVCTAIYFLVREKQRIEWHRVKHDEIYHFYFGGPVELSLISPDGILTKPVLGVDLQSGHRPQLVIPGNYWQSARAINGFALIGCTVSPGFDFRDFELSNVEKLKNHYPLLTI